MEGCVGGWVGVGMETLRENGLKKDCLSHTKNICTYPVNNFSGQKKCACQDKSYLRNVMPFRDLPFNKWKDFLAYIFPDYSVKF